MQRFQIPGGGARLPIDLGSSSQVTNLGPGTLSYADSEVEAADGTVASGSSATLSETRYLWADSNLTVRVVSLIADDLRERMEAVEIANTSQGSSLAAHGGRLDTLEGSQATQDASIASHAVDIAVVKEAPLNIDHSPYNGNIATAVAALPSTGAGLYIPAKASARTGGVTITGKDHLTIIGDGSASVLHTASAGINALKVVDCDDLTIRDLRGQGTSGTLDAFHLENCQRAKLIRPYVQGSGRYGIYAQRSFGIKVDHGVVGIDSQSPFPTGVANCTGGLVLGWDGSDITSGCNEFDVQGGHYVIGKDRGWGVLIDRAEGGTLDAPIAELTAGAILLKTCLDLRLIGGYSEFNPSGTEYVTGTVSVTNGSIAVTGSGTSWAALDAGGIANGAFGKWLLAGGRAHRIAAVNSNTSITLEDAYAGTTGAGVAYRITDGDVVLDGSANCSILGGLGGGAIIFKGSSRNKISGRVCEQVFFSTGSDYNRPCHVITNRASASISRVQDYGIGNWCQALSYQSGLLVREGPEAWIAPTLLNSWVDEGSGIFQSPGYCKDGEGFVHLKGSIKNGALGNGAFVLPTGYRPLKYLEIATSANLAHGSLWISGGGDVIPNAGSTARFNLDGVNFRAEQ